MKRSLAFLGLLMLVAGAPAALLGSVGAPYVPQFNLAEAQETLTGGLLTVDPVLHALGLAAWVLWAYLLIVVVLRMVAMTVMRRSFRFSSLLVAFTDRAAPSFVMRLVDMAVGGAMLLSSISLAAALPGSTAGAAAAAPVVKTHAPAGNGQADVATRSYVVRPGDSLWRVAAKHLGSGYRWHEIYELNQNRTFPDGRVLGDPRVIRPNWVLWLPDDSPQPAGPPISQESAPPPQSTPPPAPVQTPTPSLNGFARETAPGGAGTETHAPSRKQARPSFSRLPAIELPSGVALAASFGTGILASQGIAALRRRRQFQPTATPVSELREPEPEIVVELKRAKVPQETSHLSNAVIRLTDAWEDRSGAWPKIAWAAEAEEAISFLIESALEEDHWPKGITVGRTDGHTVAIVAKEAGPPKAHLPALEQGLLVPLAQDNSNKAVFCGLLSTNPISVKGPAALDWTVQAVLAAVSGQARHDLQVFVLGEGEPFEELAQVPHARVESWSNPDALQEAEADIRGRAQFLPRNNAPDIWAYLASAQSEFISAALIVATEPPLSMKNRMEGIAAQAGRLGCGFVAVNWEPRSSCTAISINSTLETNVPIPMIEDPLRPFLLDKKEIAEIVEIIASANPAVSKPEQGDFEAEEGGQPGVGLLPQTAPPSINGNGKRPDDGERVDDLAEYPVFNEGDFENEAPSNGSSASTKAEVVVRCLGPISVWRGDREITRGWKMNSKELLTFLIAHPDGASKDRIIEEFWPSVGSKQGDYLLRQSIYYLRKAVSGQDDAWSEKFVTRVGESVKLDKPAWEVDAWRFEELIDAAAMQPADQAIAAWRKALDLYRGEFCEDAYFAWAEPLRERFRRTVLAASVNLAEALEESGNQQEAIQVLDNAIEQDPLCEDLYRRALKLEASSGAISAAKSRYRKLASVLEKELGEEPDPSTQDLMNSLSNEGSRRRSLQKRPL